MYLKIDKSIEDMYLLSSIILMAYSVIIMSLMFFFGLYHLWMASKNVTTNETLRGAYARKSNPFDYGFGTNWHMFSDKYPNTPSSVFDLHKSLIEDEEQFYHSILARYGKLV